MRVAANLTVFMKTAIFQHLNLSDMLPRLLFTLFCSLSLLTMAQAQQNLSSIEVKKLNGETIDILEYVQEQGKTTVLSFWATWCSPCKKELDAIADFYPEWQEDFNMELIAVSIDTRRAFAKIGPMVQSRGWDYLILTDENQQLMQALNVQAVPHTFIISPQGEILWQHSSYVPGDEYELEDQLKALAGE